MWQQGVRAADVNGQRGFVQGERAAQGLQQGAVKRLRQQQGAGLVNGDTQVLDPVKGEVDASRQAGRGSPDDGDVGG